MKIKVHLCYQCSEESLRRSLVRMEKIRVIYIVTAGATKHYRSTDADIYHSAIAMPSEMIPHSGRYETAIGLAVDLILVDSSKVKGSTVKSSYLERGRKPAFVAEIALILKSASYCRIAGQEADITHRRKLIITMHSLAAFAVTAVMVMMPCTNMER